jgi:ornithine cyclodeaminase
MKSRRSPRCRPLESRKLRILNRQDVTQLLPMQDCIDVMADAMKAASSGNVSVPPRSVTSLIDHSGHMFLMPASALTPSVFGAKVIGHVLGNPAKGLPSVQGYIALFDHDTGTPVAIVEGSAITALRTAAASGLATRELARQDARSHGVMGTGVQAAAHIEAIACVRGIGRVLVWGRDAKKAEALANAEARRMGLVVIACNDPAEVAACDVVTTTTGASEPVLLGDWLTPGAHVNLVGAHTPATREADTAAMTRAKIYVDLLQSAMSEAGDILIPIEEQAMTTDAIVGELGQLVAGEIPGRTAEDDITLYKSLGIAAQDLFAAARVYERAVEESVGTEISLT